MRRLLLLVLVLLAVLPAVPAHAQDARTPVTVVAVPGLRWDAPGPLAALVDGAAVGTLSVKALPDLSCAGDGLLTLGAGARAEAFDTPCGQLPADLQEQVRRNAGSRDGAVVGLLGRELRAAGQCLRGPAAVGGTADACDVEVVLAPDAAAAADLAADRRGDVLVVGLSGLPGDTDPHLHLALASGPSCGGGGGLTSASTRRDGWVQLVDVAPTVLALRGVPVPPSVDGEPWQVRGPAPSTAELVDTDAVAQGQRDATVPFFVVVLALELVAAVALWRRTRALAVVGLAGAAVPGASFAASLLPWWRAGVPLLALLLVVAALVAVAVVAALAGPWRRQVLGPLGVVAALTTVVLLLDLVTGAQLQVRSVAGYSGLVAGRFAGIGNVAFGVLAASSLLAVACLATDRRRLAVVAGAMALVVVVDGAPPWGSDVGGVLALVPASVVLALLLTGRRVSPARLAVAGLTGAAVVTALAVADWTRDAGDRTHLGRFVQDVVDGTAGEVLQRKAEAVFALLFRSPVTALLPVVVAVVVVAVVRPPAPLRRAFEVAPSYRHALVAVGVASAVGFAVNDSGAAVPALALVVVLPATLAVVARSRAGVSEQREPVPSGLL